MTYLYSAYTEIFAQWFDSLNAKFKSELLKDYEYFFVVNHCTTINAEENKVTSAMNIIGAAVQKAVELTSKASREIF